MLQQLLIIIIHPNALSSSSYVLFSQTLPKWLLFQNWVYDVGITTYLTTLWGAKFFFKLFGGILKFDMLYALGISTLVLYLLIQILNLIPSLNLYINNGNVSVKIISNTHRWSYVVFDSFFKHLHTFQTNMFPEKLSAIKTTSSPLKYLTQKISGRIWISFTTTNSSPVSPNTKKTWKIHPHSKNYISYQMTRFASKLTTTNEPKTWKKA